jgi:hypothetical protein
MNLWVGNGTGPQEAQSRCLGQVVMFINDGGTDW